jgi:hypothetical protein
MQATSLTPAPRSPSWCRRHRMTRTTWACS